MQSQRQYEQAQATTAESLEVAAPRKRYIYTPASAKDRYIKKFATLLSNKISALNSQKIFVLKTTGRLISDIKTVKDSDRIKLN